jgi:hypothetical protein
MTASMQRSHSLINQFIDRIHHIVDCACVFKVFRFKRLAGHFFQFNDHVDRIDTVKIEVFVKVRFQRSPKR